MKNFLLKNKRIIIYTLAVILVVTVIIVAVTVQKAKKKKDENLVSSATTVSSLSNSTEVSSQTEDVVEEESDEPETIYIKETEAYMLIGRKFSDNDDEVIGYASIDNFDGGKLITLNGCNGYGASTLSDEEDIIKAIYITGYDKYIMNDVYTGSNYSHYANNISGLTAIKYDSSSLAYACSYKENVNNKAVTVWLYFNFPNGKCTGAIITTDKLKTSSVSTKAENNKFLYQYEKLPCSELFEAYPEYYQKNLICVDPYSEIGVGANVYFGGTTSDKSIDEYKDTAAKFISISNMHEEGNGNFSDIEVLPGIKIGYSRDSFKTNGYNLIHNPQSGYDSYFCLLRVGAANVCPAFMFDENNKLNFVGYGFD